MINNEYLEIPHCQALLAQELILTAWQYGPTGKYIGEFKFHNNLDSMSVHLPMNTVLVEPKLREDQDAFWDDLLKQWVLVDKINEFPEDPRNALAQAAQAEASQLMNEEMEVLKAKWEAEQANVIAHE